MPGLRTQPALLLLATLLLGAVPANAKSLHAGRFDVQAALSPDGSLQVVETLRLEFRDGTYTRVWRELPTRRTDGITGIVASMDGTVLSDARGDRYVDVDVRRRLIRVEWHFPASSGLHTFALAYRVAGAIERRPDDDRLSWTFLPRDHDYDIEASTISLTWPASAIPLGFATDTRRRIVVEPPSRQGDRVTVSARDIGRDAWLELQARFAPATASASVPAWQALAVRQREFTPMLLSGAVAITAVLVLGFVLMWARAPRGRVDERDEVPGTAPPDDLPVAVAGALLTHNVKPGASQALATIFDLARRGVLRVDEDVHTSRWGMRTYSVRKLGANAVLARHERALVDLMFVKGDHAPLHGVLGRVTSGDPTIVSAVRDVLRSRGLLDDDRLVARHRLQWRGAVVATLGVAGVTVLLFTVRDIGGHVLWAPAGVMVAGLVGVFLGAIVSPLSDAGLRAAARWRGFARHLRQVARGRAPVGAPHAAESTLAMAATFGDAEAWARAMQKQHLPVPAWFTAGLRHSDDGSAAFLTMVTTNGSTGGDGASASGASGGGGSSGAD